MLFTERIAAAGAGEGLAAEAAWLMSSLRMRVSILTPTVPWPSVAGGNHGEGLRGRSQALEPTSPPAPLPLLPAPSLQLRGAMSFSLAFFRAEASYAGSSPPRFGSINLVFAD